MYLFVGEHWQQWQRRRVCKVEFYLLVGFLHNFIGVYKRSSIFAQNSVTSDAMNERIVESFELKITETLSHADHYCAALFSRFYCALLETGTKFYLDDARQTSSLDSFNCPVSR